ncbi:MAG: hypothetical protein ACJ74O_00120 [Frankiaceae bacterium]
MIATISAAGILPAMPASAASVSASRTGMSSSMNFNWINSHRWSNGYLSLSDTAADGDPVKVNIWDGYQLEGTRNNSNGSGTTLTWSGMYFDSGNLSLPFIYFEGCVVRALIDDACTNGARSYNPYA